MSRSIASPVPGQAGNVLTIWALTASGSFDNENEPLLDKITVSTNGGSCSGPTPSSCQAQDDSPGKVAKKRVKWGNVIVTLCLWLAYVLCNVAYSTINPFFPQIAESKGANSVLIGVIISTTPFCVFTLSPVFGYLLPRVPVWLQILCGLFLVSCSYTSLGFVTLLPSGWIFVLVCVLLRMVEGVGTAILSTVIYSTFPLLFPNRVATLVGLFELGAGFGYGLGPSIGGILYQYGGSRLPFLSVGGCILLFMLPCTLLVRKINIVRDKNPLPMHVIRKVSRNAVFLTLIMVIALSAYSGVYIAPSLPIFLHQWFHQSPFQIGMLYVTGSVAYVFSVLVVGLLIDKVGHNKSFTITGLVTIAVAFLITGLPYYLEFINIWFIWITYVLVELGVGIAVVSIYPELLKIARRYTNPGDGTNALSSFISGLVASSMNLSFVISPLVGGAVTTVLTIPEFSVILAEVLIAQAMLLMGLSVIDRICR